jgi:PAP2 superfamily
MVQTNLTRPTRVERRPLWWRLGHEALLLGVLWMAYTLGRALAGRHVGSAYGHATQIWRLERDLRLPDEARVQLWALSHPDLVRLANDYYKFEHWVALGAVACWLLVSRPDRYLWFRRVLVLTTALALAGHFAYPLMPPRMRPDLGLVDTGVQFGQSVYGPNYANHGLVNQYAAMPSMHVGWAVLFAVTVVLVARTPWRWLMVLYPCLTTWVVVATGNHYWLDGVAGAVVLCLALFAVHRLTRSGDSDPAVHVQ